MICDCHSSVCCVAACMLVYCMDVSGWCDWPCHGDSGFGVAVGVLRGRMLKQGCVKSSASQGVASCDVAIGLSA
jgi:hypothetical protein